MVLAKNLNPGRRGPKIEFAKFKKPILIGLVVAALLAGTFGVIYLTRIVPKEEDKQAIVLETGDRPLPSTISLWVTAEGGLVMREEPDISSKQLKLIPNGTTLTATEKEGDWYQVEYMNQTGWVNKNYVTEKAPKEDPTKNWNTYADKEFGYTLRYPKDWVAQEYGENPATNSESYVGFGLQLPAKLDPAKLPPVIVRVTKESAKTVEGEYKTEASSSMKKVKVSGMSSSKFTFNDASGTQITAYVIPKGALTMVVEETGGYATELGQIISSLNLT